MDKTITALAISIIAILASIGIPISERTFGEVLTDELRDYYICDLTNEIKEFKGGISGTQYSGYPYIDSRKGAVRCGTTDNKGRWNDLKTYAESLGIDPYDLLEESKIKKEPVVYKEYAKQWLCSTGGCERLK